MALTVQENTFFYITVFWGVKSGKDEKLNGLDKLQKILDKQADQPQVFSATVCFS